MDRRGLVLLALWLLVRSSQVAAAEPPVALWGVYRCAPDTPGSCEHIVETEPDVEKLVQQFGASQWSLAGSGAAGLPACTPPQCGVQVTSACGTAAGRVLGVFVQQKKPVTQVRAWLYDIVTQKLAVHDNYCNDCDINTAVKDNVKTLLTAPLFRGYAGATPSYCNSTEPLRASALHPPRGPVAIIVVNDGKKSLKYGSKDGASELKSYLLRQGHREAITISQVPAKPSIDALRKLLEGDKRNQVLIVEGIEQVSLFDGTTEKTSDAVEISCDGCDYKQYVERLKSATGSLLDHCFGSECAGATAQSKPPAPEACRPFPEPTQLPAASSASPPAGAANRIDPQLARMTKGMLWGLVVAGTATTVGLAVANNFVRENRDVSGTDLAGNSFSAHGLPFDNVYAKAALTATGFTVALLGVAIPITIGIVRSERAAEPPPRVRVAPSQGIQCFK